jgi:plastocyanin
MGSSIKRLGIVAAGIAVLAAGCARSEPEVRPVQAGGSPTPSAGAGSPTPVSGAPAKVDPRDDGFEVGFGEFAVTLEARAIRPGPVTFVVRNGGKLVHGFEMELEGGDSSGSGSGDDGFKIERPTFDPGESIRVRMNLAPGVYKVECFVANHDDLGMEALLEVSPNAPLVRQAPAGGAGGDAVAMAGFAFEPATLEVPAGTEVTWTNQDPAQHTVTADDGSFDSGPIDQGATFATTVNGPVTYVCAIHPTMTGEIRVA